MLQAEERSKLPNSTNLAQPDNDIVLPGVFANERLFLQGARLTTSYDDSIQDVHVGLFGFPGDLVREPPPEDDWGSCPATKISPALRRRCRKCEGLMSRTGLLVLEFSTGILAGYRNVTGALKIRRS
jgi:hypothetical protein